MADEFASELIKKKNERIKKLEKELKEEKENTLDILRHALNHPSSSYTSTNESEILIDWEKSLAEELDK
jgi:hypothetical protein